MANTGACKALIAGSIPARRSIAIRRDKKYMRKIPTIFKRDANNGGRIINEYIIDPKEFDGAIATEKIDGMNVRVTVRNHTPVRMEKRRNPSKLEKARGIVEPWYVDTSLSSEDQYLNAALKGTNFSDIPDGEWSGEAVGPDIQGNPLNLLTNRIVFFSLGECPAFPSVPVTFEALESFLKDTRSQFNSEVGIEGIVWHCKNGNMMKIKTKDFTNDGR